MKPTCAAAHRKCMRDLLGSYPSSNLKIFTFTTVALILGSIGWAFLGERPDRWTSNSECLRLVLSSKDSNCATPGLLRLQRQQQDRSRLLLLAHCLPTTQLAWHQKLFLAKTLPKNTSLALLSGVPYFQRSQKETRSNFLAKSPWILCIWHPWSDQQLQWSEKYKRNLTDWFSSGSFQGFEISCPSRHDISHH